MNIGCFAAVCCSLLQMCSSIMMNGPICTCQVKHDPCPIMVKRTFFGPLCSSMHNTLTQRVGCFSWISVSIENVTGMTSMIVTDMLESLQWESVESQRIKAYLMLMYKTMNQIIAIPPPYCITLVPYRLLDPSTDKSSSTPDIIMTHPNGVSVYIGRG